VSRTADELIPTRATLLQRLKNWQDQSSWQEFFDTYWRLIYGFAVKNGMTREEAEDVVQDTLIAVAKHMPTFQYDPSIGSFKTWLLNLTRWRISDHLRRRKSNTVPLPANGPDTEVPRMAVDIQEPDLEKVWDIEWKQNLVNAAIANVRRRLDPFQYQLYDFFLNKNLEPEVVAKTFDVPVSKVYMAKHRITEAIRQEIERIDKEMI
jgi:RNA polymerase sigma-70 factor (ECF subfamily)